MSGNAAALADLITPQGSAFLARVSALNEDGTVSLEWGAEPVLGVAASRAYADRQVGDVVIVSRVQGQLIVTGTANAQESPIEDLIDAAISPVSDSLDDTIDNLNGLDDFAHDLDDDVTRLENVRPRVTFGSSNPPGGFRQASAIWFKDQGDGRVDLYLVVSGGGSASSEPTRPAKPPTKKTTKTPKPVTLTPSSRGSWRSSGQTDSAVWQGDWTGRGNWTGGWFYGTSIASACSGKSVKSMTFTIARTKDGSGWGRGVPAHLNLHGKTSKSKPSAVASGHAVKLAPGQKVSYSLPAAWVSALASGSARGFMLSGSGRGDYLKCSGAAGSLRIVFN